MYNVLIHSGIGELARMMEARLVPSDSEGEGPILYDRNGMSTGFTPQLRKKTLDLDDPSVKGGLSISLDLFAQMHAYCQQRDINLLVALIPTKESVHAKYLENDPVHGQNSLIRSLLTNERKVNATVKTFFEGHNISYVDLLPELQQQVSNVRLYPGNHDGHLNKYGNGVVAETLQRHLVEGQPRMGSTSPKSR